MYWTDEIITSRAEAVAFLGKQWKAVPLADRLTRIREKDNKWDYSQSTNVVNKELPLFSLIVDCKQERIENLDINYNWRGHGFGRMAVKAAIGVAHEAGIEKLSMTATLEDGFGFWPSMGAVPVDRSRNLGRDISRELLVRGNIDDEARADMTRIAEVASKDFMQGWRALSQTSLKLPEGGYFKHAVFKRWDNQEMVLDVRDPDTRTILQNRIGALPELLPQRPGMRPSPALPGNDGGVS